MTAKPVLLVSGSRNIGAIHSDPVMDNLFYVSIIRRALANGWDVIAGDAKGVDYNLAYAATAIEFASLAPFMMVYGIQETPRHGVQSQQVLYTNIADRCQAGTAKERYQLRDDHMLSQADYVYCLWDGKSKGTERVYNRAIEMGFITNTNAWLKVLA